MYGNSSAPASVDWRTNGSVTPVKNQAQVGLRAAPCHTVSCSQTARCQAPAGAARTQALTLGLCGVQCGSCWAFSTTGSIEGINAIYTGKLESLSEQELVDCDKSRDHGCHGGLMDFAFTFVIQNGGIDTEEDYKYTAQEDKCSNRRSHRNVVTIDGYEDVPPNSEHSLKQVCGRADEPCICLAALSHTLLSESAL